MITALIVDTTTVYVVVPSSTTPNFAPTPFQVTTYDFTLTANVSSSTAAGFTAGQIVVFILRIASPGPYTFTWPSNVINPPVVNTAEGSNTTFIFVVDQALNLYPLTTGVWS